MNAQKKNPLYVVSDKGNVVEEALGKFDFFIKKLGLAPLVNFLKEFFQQLLSTVENYQMFVVIKNFIDTTLNQLTAVLMKFAN